MWPVRDNALQKRLKVVSVEMQANIAPCFGMVCTVDGNGVIEFFSRFAADETHTTRPDVY
jgi:hypothetical protein